MFGRSVEYDPRISKITRQLAAIESSSRTLGGSAGCKAWAGTSNARNILNLSHTWQHVTHYRHEWQCLHVLNQSRIARR